jgi:Na+-driven multidrug efflux pump
MQLNTTYRQILAISAPIMIGSAAQNIITLTDSIFLYHLGEADFATIGFVGVFYLIIASIGYGFSKSGQIMIARRMGEGNPQEVGKTFRAMLVFELCLATLMFCFMRFGAAHFFALFVKSPVIYYKSLEFIYYRSYGVFFSYMGVAFVALYTGVARTQSIVVNTIILGAVNIVLCYGLIFGKWSLPEMGIGGAALASTIAEMVAFTLFVGYIFWDKQSKPYQLFQFDGINIALIKQQLKLAAPMVAQSVVGLGSWFIFFSLIEHLGERELAITNLVRMVYLSLSIPCWGFASGINTLVSNIIGQGKRVLVLPAIWKTAKICLFTTLVFTLPIIIYPEKILSFVLGGNAISDTALILDSKPVLHVLLFILITFSVSGVFFNGLAGIGATMFGLKLQSICAVLYVAIIYYVVNHTDYGLEWSWAVEILYWLVILCCTVWYLRSNSWHELKV